MGPDRKIAIPARLGLPSRLWGGTSAVLTTLGIAAAYYLAAQFGLQLQLVRGQVTPLWPPTGVALVCLLLLSGRIWPGVTLGALLVNLPIGPSVSAVVAIAAGNTLAPLCAYWLLRRVGFRIEMSRLRDGLLFVSLGAMGMLVSATVGSVALFVAGAIPAHNFWTVWSVWWTGDAMGVLVIAPLLLFFRTARWPRSVPVRWLVEAAAVVVSTAVVTVAVTQAPLSMLFLVFPFLIWAALRFQMGGATLCVLIASGLTIWAAEVGSGPFAGHGLLAKMIILQAFNLSAALTGLLLAVITIEKKTAFHGLERAYRQLSDAATEQEALQHQLARQALRDPLTGLSNRLPFTEQLKATMEDRATSITATVMFVDVDDLKIINDSLGHETGDAVLNTVATRLTDFVSAQHGPSTNMAARLGGDEFAMLLTGIVDENALEATADALTDELARPVLIGGNELTCAASVGITTGADASEAKDMLQNADLALYAAKETGKRQWRRFQPSMRATLAARRALQTSLAFGVSNNEFFLEYQPIMCLNGAGTVGFEALLRWQHPNHGRLAPNQFVDVAEESGLINAIGEWVMLTAFEDAQSWHEHSTEPSPCVAINISARQFRSQHFVPTFLRLLAESGLEAECVIAEITESLLLQQDNQVCSDLERLRTAGIKIAIDDFGTGYSALSYLQYVPLDIIKLDRSFIASMTHSIRQNELVRGIVGLAKVLDLKVIAEGIQTPAEKAAATRAGCDMGQGFIFSRPMNRAQVADWITRHHVPQVDCTTEHL